jgi:hypothetical protein
MQLTLNKLSQTGQNSQRNNEMAEGTSTSPGAPKEMQCFYQ